MPLLMFTICCRLRDTRDAMIRAYAATCHLMTHRRRQHEDTQRCYVSERDGLILHMLPPLLLLRVLMMLPRLYARRARALQRACAIRC